MKDWTGNNKSVYTRLGASNHAINNRVENDYYATEPKAAELLLDVEPELDNIWECACGEGHLSEVFKKANKLNIATDIIYRNYKCDGIKDFLDDRIENYSGDIVTNPPYKLAKDFILKALSIVGNGRKVCMFMKLTFLEGKERKKLFKKYPPKTVYVCSGRINCCRNGEFEKYKSTAIAYAWFVWEKGYKGETILNWIN